MCSGFKVLNYFLQLVSWFWDCEFVYAKKIVRIPIPFSGCRKLDSSPSSSLPPLHRLSLLFYCFGRPTTFPVPPRWLISPPMFFLVSVGPLPPSSFPLAPVWEATAFFIPPQWAGIPRAFIPCCLMSHRGLRRPHDLPLLRRGFPLMQMKPSHVKNKNQKI